MQTDPNWSNFFYNPKDDKVEREREREREREGGREGEREGERGEEGGGGGRAVCSSILDS